MIQTNLNPRIINEGLSGKPRLIAFYLPQYHPILENDTWWGAGFTEWRNVVKAKPLFRGHGQPHLPTDLGFYDLRLTEAREDQANLAARYGIHGFCYWHYWFGGKRLLEKPFSAVAASNKPSFPYCLAWANETWSRRWLGEERDVLMEQTYSVKDDELHGQWLAKVFTDDRYIKVNGRPLFLIYRPKHLPDALKTTDTLRQQCLMAGVTDPFILGIDAHCHNYDCRMIGFDGTVSFEPQLGVLPDYSNDGFAMSKLIRNLRLGIFSHKLKIYDDLFARDLMKKNKPQFPYYPSIFVGWDNTPRRGNNGIVLVNSTPDGFGSALEGAIKYVQGRNQDERLIFINAWNEWAEGNHLEPDTKYGLSYLNKISEIVCRKASDE